MPWIATPERPLTLLYDGECRFCIAGSARLMRLAAPEVLRRVSNKDQQEMAKFPASVCEGISSALQLVSADGEIATGAAAVNRVLATRPVWRLITWVYWVPGIKQLTDWMYTLVARNRYRIMGKAGGGTGYGACENGACGVEQGVPRGRC